MGYPVFRLLQMKCYKIGVSNGEFKTRLFYFINIPSSLYK
jgi:hypothetical protein